MGVFGALNAAVSGLRAQSFALENISGNIANSQTTGFKRQDTSFQELVVDQGVDQRSESSGAVSFQSRPTNEIQGNIEPSEIDTFIAINGDGYFIVEQPTGIVNGETQFATDEVFTRAGDFTRSQEGFFENGAGFVLQGFPLDPTTGLRQGDEPQRIIIDEEDLLPVQTSEISFIGNFPITPATVNQDDAIPGSELLSPALRTGSVGNTTISPAENQAFLDSTLPIGSVTAFDALGSPLDIELRAAKTESAPAGTDTYNIYFASQTGVPEVVVTPAALDVTTGGGGTLDLSAISAGDTITLGAGSESVPIIFSTTPADANAALTEIQSAITAAIGAGTLTNNLTVGNNAGTLEFRSNNADLTFTFNDTPSNGTLDQSFNAAAVTNGDQIIIADGAGAPVTVTFGTGPGEIDASTPFANTAALAAAINASFPDVAVTDNAGSNGLLLSSVNGNPTFQFIDNDGTADVATQTGTGFGDGNSDVATLTTVGGANGTELVPGSPGGNVYTRLDQQFTFIDGLGVPPVQQLAIPTLTVNGTTLSNVELDLGARGITQFDVDQDGFVSGRLESNGFPPGQFAGVAFNDGGLVTVTYSNGQSVDLFEIGIASFNADAGLRRIDGGGAFAATAASGEPILGATGFIVGGALEASNTDIADEFTKLIITQQAYTANSRIVTTSDEILSEAINIIR